MAAYRQLTSVSLTTLYGYILEAELAANGPVTLEKIILLEFTPISAIPDWLSDCVCQLAFGGGFASRTLFTNDERSVIYAQRPVILVGITHFVLRGDLRDRSV